MALAAFTSILLIAGCSSSSKTPTNPKASRTLALQALMFFRRKAWIAADIRWPSRHSHSQRNRRYHGGTIDIVNSDQSSMSCRQSRSDHSRVL